MFFFNFLLLKRVNAHNYTSKIKNKNKFRNCFGIFNLDEFLIIHFLNSEELVFFGKIYFIFINSLLELNRLELNIETYRNIEYKFIF